MRTKKIDNTKVGLLVLAGLIFLVLTLYMIGKNKNLLGSTFTIKAAFNNVNGVVPGNNVRYKGMDVGTVASIKVANDTAIYVTMTIDEKMRPFIKKNAIASIGTDGIMGNRIINVNSSNIPADVIESNDVIQTRGAIETDEMLRTLNTTNQNIERITVNLYEISRKLNRGENLWMLLSDTSIASNLKNTAMNLNKASSNIVSITATGKHIVTNLQNENGIMYKLFSDTAISNQLTRSLKQIENTSNETSQMMKDLRSMVYDMKQGEGTAGLLFTDTLLRQSIHKSALNVEQGTARFNENMEALKSHVLFRKYYEKQEKERKKAAEAKKD